jgi:DNA adenine methylase
MSAPLKAPFPWYGSKRRVADQVWSRFGPVDHYVEPFAGSLAVLLARPGIPGAETVNDLDGCITNFWRAVKTCPDLLAAHAEYPVSELDLHARHRWLIHTQPRIPEQLAADPDWCDPRAAGWWVWGVSQWMGGGWCWLDHKRRPKLGLPCGQGTIALQAKGTLLSQIQRLAWRLKDVRILCGDWARLCTRAALLHDDNRRGVAGVMLDPPYSLALRDDELYREDGGDVAASVRDWCLAHGEDPRLRIALCGLEGEHEMPSSWSVFAWSSQGASNKKGTRNSDSRHRERIWFSPHCKTGQGNLF